jgi:hypothetical protein
MYPPEDFDQTNTAMNNRVQDLFPAPRSKSLPRRAASAAVGILSGRKKRAEAPSTRNSGVNFTAQQQRCAAQHQTI